MIYALETSQAWLLLLVRTKITPWEAPSGPKLLQIACWAVWVTLRPSHWCAGCCQGPFPSAGCAAALGSAWGGFPVTCGCVWQVCHAVHTHPCSRDLQTAARVVVWAGLCKCVSEGWPQNDGHEASSTSRELSLVALLLFHSPSSKSGNLCLPTHWEIDGMGLVLAWCSEITADPNQTL